MKYLQTRDGLIQAQTADASINVREARGPPMSPMQVPCLPRVKDHMVLSTTRAAFPALFNIFFKELRRVYE